MSSSLEIIRDLRRFDLDAEVGQTAFTFPRPLFDALDLRVQQKIGPAAAFANVASGYIVTPAADRKSASVVFAVPPRQTAEAPAVTIRLDGARIASRTTDVTRSGTIVATLLERELDLFAIIAQELRRDINGVGPDVLDAATTAAASAIGAEAAAARAEDIEAGIIPAGAIGTDEIADDAVTLEKLAADVIGELADKQQAAAALTAFAILGPTLTAGDLLRATGPNTFERVPSSAVGSVVDVAMLAMELADVKNSTILAAGWWAESYDTLTTFSSNTSTNVDTSEAGVLKPLITRNSLIPVMTAATTSGVTVSGSSYYSDGYPYKAFDGNESTAWVGPNSSTGQWLQVSFPAPVSAASYRLWSGSTATDGGQHAWTLSGSNDGSTWAVLDTRSGLNLSAYATFTLSAVATYKHFRWTFTATSGWPSEGEITLFAPPVQQNADIRFAAQDIGAVPATLDIYAAVQQVDSLTWGTDFLVYGTRDGASWAPSAGITVIGTVGALTLIRASVAVAGQPSGRTVAPRFVSANGKSFKLHGHYIAGRA